MSDILCGYPDREAMLMSYLYDDISPSDRGAFDAHLTTCARCRVELNALGGVREQLSRWAPPEYASSHQSVAGSVLSSVGTPQPPVQLSPVRPVMSIAPRIVERDAREAGDERRGRNDIRWSWREVPAWAQAAAALLVLGASAGMANLNVHYDAQNGLNIRTGWSQNPSNSANPANPANPANLANSANPANFVNRDDLTALEQQLRGEMRAISAAASTTRAAAATDGEVPRRVKAMLDETERRHERELALRVAEVMRDINAQRQSDLRKIDLTIDQGRVEVLRNRQMLDYYVNRVSRPQ